jgi:large subunit ribosomal protein L35
MSKNKPHKGLLKRIRISKTGKVRHRTAGHKHLRSGKGGKRLRSLRKDPFISNSDAVRLERGLFRRLRGRDQARSAIKKSPSPAQRKAAKVAKKAVVKTVAKAWAKAADPKPSVKSVAKASAKAAAKK